MTIKYKTTKTLTTKEFINILKRSTLGERRPIDDEKCIQGMLDHADVLVLAFDGGKVVGVASEYYPKIGFTQHMSAWVLIK